MSSLLSFSKLALSASFRVAPSSSVTVAARGYATKKLFIGNIAWGTTDEEAREHFQQFGTITDLHFPKDDQGRTKGFGFIEMEEAECNKVVEEANGRPFKGRDLRIQFADRFKKGDGNKAGNQERRRPREAGAPRIRSDGSGVYRPYREEGERQFRPREEGERRFRPREEGERQFRPRRQQFQRQHKQSKDESE